MKELSEHIKSLSQEDRDKSFDTAEEVIVEYITSKKASRK